MQGREGGAPGHGGGQQEHLTQPGRRWGAPSRQAAVKSAVGGQWVTRGLGKALGEGGWGP